MRRRALAIAIAAAALAGALSAALFVWIEFQNNNQGEYFDTVTGRVDLPYVALNFAMVFAETAIVVFVPAFLVLIMVGWLSRRPA